MSAKAKGAARERQARDIYERAGYAVQPFYGRRYGETDGFSHIDVPCDFVAVRNPGPVVFGQVKSNRATGIGAWFDAAAAAFPPGVEAHFLIPYDRQGWRLCVRESSGLAGGNGGRDGRRSGAYVTAYDEREYDCKMGDGLAAFLRGGE